MKSFKEMETILKESLPNKRFVHSMAVCETAERFAKIHKIDVNKAKIGGLLHDCGRQINTSKQLDKARKLKMEIDFVEQNQPILLHAKLGVYYAKKKYGVVDKEVLSSIRKHSTGGVDMNSLDMVVYLADLLEPTRDFPGIDKLRKLAEEDLELAMIKAYEQSIDYLIQRGLLIHPDCVLGRNQLVAKRKQEVRTFKKDYVIKVGQGCVELDG